MQIKPGGVGGDGGGGRGSCSDAHESWHWHYVKGRAEWSFSGKFHVGHEAN